MVRFKKINHKGITLVELLVVMVIMGLVITSVYSLFINSKRTSRTSEEVVDVQQNLRVAMETLVADIRMAGFLLPDSTTAITSAPDIFGIDDNDDGDFLDTDDSGALFTLQTPSSEKTYARVMNEDLSGTTVTLEIEADMLDQFETNHRIRVIRPATLVDLTGSGADWVITAVDDTNNEISFVDAGYVAGTIEAGDMIIKKLPGEAPTAVINYWLIPTPSGGDNNFELIREDGNAKSVVASYINAVDLTYLMQDGSEQTAPTAVEDIRAVRVVISAETDNTKTGKENYSGVKRRSLQTLTKIRNAFGE